MGAVLEITFSTETEKNTISNRFWCGFGYLLGPFGVILVAKWGSRGASLRGRNFDGKKGREEVGGNWQQLPAIGSTFENLGARPLKNNVEGPQGKTPEPEPTSKTPIQTDLVTPLCHRGTVADITVITS